MRRSICFVEPALARAGEIHTWRFVYTPAVNLPKGAQLKFDLVSKGREIDWEHPTTNLKDKENVIYAELENGKELAAKEVENPNHFLPHFLFTLPTEIKAGGQITIVIGCPKKVKLKKGEELGNMAQRFTQRRRSFHLYIDVTGKGRFDEPEVFHLDIKGNALTTIKILSPSLVAKNKRFDVMLRFEDAWNNLTSLADPETMIELSYEHLRENLSWKLFVPETGFVTLPNLYFNEEGVYTIQLRNTLTNECYYSAPVRSVANKEEQIYWGITHGESERYDSLEDCDNCLRHFRDDMGYNFYCSSYVNNPEETSIDGLKNLSQTLQEYHEDDRFITFGGYQYIGTPKKEGARQILFAKEQKLPLFNDKELKGMTLEKLYKAHSPKELISIATFTMGKGSEYQFKDCFPEYERLVEIYNAWGSSERTKKEGNSFPIESKKKGGMSEATEGSIHRALDNNCRLGFVGGGLDDRGIYSQFWDSDQTQYPSGATAIIAQEYTKAAFAEALYNRSCYATTGEKIILTFTIAGSGMGSEMSTEDKPGLTVNRHIDVFTAGTDQIILIELIRNGKVLEKYTPDAPHFSFTYDDMESLEKISMKCRDKKPPFVYYYVRVTQANGHMAWSSPIWIDYIPTKPVGKFNKPKKGAMAESS